MKNKCAICLAKILLLFFVFFLLSVPSFAMRPLQTDDFGTLDIGKIEIEAGYLNMTNSTGIRTEQAGLVLKRGMFNGIEMSLEIPYSMTGPSEICDIICHGKFRLNHDDSNAWTLRTDIKFDTCPSDSPYTDMALYVINSRKIQNFYIHSNLVYGYVGISPGTQSANYLQASSALQYPLINEKLNIVSEIVWNNSAVPNSTSLLAGCYYEINEEFKVDIAYNFALNDSASKYFTFGITKGI